MFCPFCGSQTPSNSSFCISCGKSIIMDNNTPPANQLSYHSSIEAKRQEELSKLDSIINYFTPKQSIFDSYDISGKKLIEAIRSGSNALLIWGCILASLGLLFLIILLSESPNDSDASGPFIFLLLIPGIFMVIGGISKKVARNNYLSNCQHEFCNLSSILCSYYNSYPDCPIGPEYINPRILFLIRITLESGQAVTINQALNLVIARSNHNHINYYTSMIRTCIYDYNSSFNSVTIFLPSHFFR